MHLGIWAVQPSLEGDAFAKVKGAASMGKKISTTHPAVSNKDIRGASMTSALTVRQNMIIILIRCMSDKGSVHNFRTS